MKKLVIILILLIIVAAGVLGAGYYIYANEIDIDNIYEGVKIDGHNVGGMSKQDAKNLLMAKMDEHIQEKSISLYYNDIKYDYTLNDFGFSYDYEEAVNKAYELGREGNLFDRYKEIRNIKNNGVEIPLDEEYNRDKVLEIVDELEENVYREAKDSTFDFNNGKFIVTEEQKGMSLDKNKLIKLIVENIGESKDIEMPMDIVEPKYKKEMFSRINGIIGEFSTSFKGSAPGRIQNIKLASSSISNKVIMPGEQISYNDTIGPIQAKYGYMEAPVILNGELTPGMGGGVCQSSTTLYNALLLADVSIVERHPHSIAASYVPRGTDGAVARGYLDLKFRNDFDFPIYTDSKIVGDRIYFYIYGDTKAKDYTVKIEPELIQTLPYKVHEIYDASLEPGAKVMEQEGRTGYKVKTYKSIIKNGQVIERNLINNDYYRERDFIYKVGPALPSGQVNTAADSSIPANSADPAESMDILDENIEVIDLQP